MADLVETLKGVGDTINAGLLGMKNVSVSSGPGKGVPALGKSLSGPVRYSKDGSPPFKNVDNSGLTKEPLP